MLIMAGWKRRNWNRIPNAIALMAFLLLGASVINGRPSLDGSAGMPDSGRNVRQEAAPDHAVNQGPARTAGSGSKRAEPRLILFRHG